MLSAKSILGGRVALTLGPWWVCKAVVPPDHHVEWHVSWFPSPCSSPHIIIGIKRTYMTQSSIVSSSSGSVISPGSSGREKQWMKWTQQMGSCTTQSFLLCVYKLVFPFNSDKIFWAGSPSLHYKPFKCHQCYIKCINNGRVCETMWGQACHYQINCILS